MNTTMNPRDGTISGSGRRFRPDAIAAACALEQNRDLREAVLNVEAARSQYRIQRSALVPSLGAYGEGARQRMPADISPTGSAATAGQYSAGIMASYELDFFGRVRGMSTEALESYLATEEARRSAHISLVAEVANAYLGWAVDSQLLELARNTQQTRERTVELVERQYQVGVATQLDLSQARGALHDARSNTAEFDRLVQQDINALQFLTGSSETLSLGTAPTQLDNLVHLADIPAALPSDILLSRPDIRAAEHAIRAANGSIGAARAAFFPRIVLTGTAGTACSRRRRPCLPRVPSSSSTWCNCTGRWAADGSKASAARPANHLACRLHPSAQAGGRRHRDRKE